MPKDSEGTKKRRNASGKRVLRSERLNDFVRKAGRKAQKGREPNDRRYDNSLQRSIRRMKPEELDQLLRDGEDD